MKTGLFMRQLWAIIVVVSLLCSALQSDAMNKNETKFVNQVSPFVKDNIYKISLATIGFLVMYNYWVSGNEPQNEPQDGNLPFIFHPDYDISFWGLEKLHPFDSSKYGKVYKYLVSEIGLDPEQFVIPCKVTDKELLQIHTQEYLDSLNNSWTVAHISEVYPVGYLPNFLVQRCVLDPMRRAVKGTELAILKAVKEKKNMVNLSGGYHHAKPDNGEGFCVFADAPLAIESVRKATGKRDLRVMIVDTDAHQGNGNAECLKDDENTAIFDMYNNNRYPGDKEKQKKHIKYAYPLSGNNSKSDNGYLEILYNNLPQAIQELNPDVIIYNAGTDPYETDRLGGMNLSKEAIIKRDEFVFEQSKKNNAPIAMVLSGGYTKESHEIISASLHNLIKKGYLEIPKKEDTLQKVVC